MSKGNIYNDIQKGLYDLAITELDSLKKIESHLSEYCDLLILVLRNSQKTGIKPKNKDINLGNYILV